MKKRLVNWDEYQGMVAEIARQISLTEWRPDLIIGVTRGGAPAAVMLSHYFDCNMIGLSVSLRETNKDGNETNAWAAEDAAGGRKILIVDDVNDTGATINWIINDWSDSFATPLWPDNVRFAVLVNNEASKSDIVPRYSAEVVNNFEDQTWVVFPYEKWWNV